MKHFKKIILMGLGFFFVLLGLIGIFLPVIPGIPFLFIAAVIFSQSSEKFHSFLINNKWVGHHIKNHKKGIELKVKIFLLAIQWTSLAIALVFFIDEWLYRILLLIFTLAITVFILFFLKTHKK